LRLKALKFKLIKYLVNVLDEEPQSEFKTLFVLVFLNKKTIGFGRIGLYYQASRAFEHELIFFLKIHHFEQVLHQKTIVSQCCIYIFFAAHNL